MIIIINNNSINKIIIYIINKHNQHLHLNSNHNNNNLNNLNIIHNLLLKEEIDNLIDKMNNKLNKNNK